MPLGKFESFEKQLSNCKTYRCKALFCILLFFSSGKRHNQFHTPKLLLSEGHFSLNHSVNVWGYKHMIRIQVSYWLVNNTLSTYTLIANSGHLNSIHFYSGSSSPKTMKLMLLHLLNSWLCLKSAFYSCGFQFWIIIQIHKTE